MIYRFLYIQPSVPKLNSAGKQTAGNYYPLAELFPNSFDFIYIIHTHTSHNMLNFSSAEKRLTYNSSSNTLNYKPVTVMYSNSETL